MKRVGRTSGHWRALALATVVVVVVSLSVGLYAARTCEEIKTGLLESCQKYVMGVDPPEPEKAGECCSVVTDPNVFCVCNLSIPPGVINETALKTVIYACGLAVPPEYSNCAGFNIGN